MINAVRLMVRRIPEHYIAESGCGRWFWRKTAAICLIVQVHIAGFFWLAWPAMERQLDARNLAGLIVIVCLLAATVYLVGIAITEVLKWLHGRFHECEYPQRLSCKRCRCELCETS